jgi:hypothetical protein
LDLFDASTQRQIVYFFTRAGSLAGHLHALASTNKESRELCKQHAIDAAKGKSTALGNSATTCCVICESSYPKSSL